MRKPKRYVLAFALSGLILVVAASFSDAGNGDSWRLIGLRNIGHQLLLHHGDSTSRVLPVKRLSETRYQLQFERPFAFSTDTLAALVDREARNRRLPSSYTVSVLDCETGQQHYAFGRPVALKETVPCLGREQPVRRYCINFDFEDSDTPIPPLVYAGAIPILLLLLGLGKPNKKAATALAGDGPGFVAIGAYRYYPKTQSLLLGPVRTTLTAKESRVLEIFASHPNEVIPRETLRKEVWENEGVIVGRSLDVFISKLRKKLEGDACIKIVSAHGKGYKLIIE